MKPAKQLNIKATYIRTFLSTEIDSSIALPRYLLHTVNYIIGCLLHRQSCTAELKHQVLITTTWNLLIIRERWKETLPAAGPLLSQNKKKLQRKSEMHQVLISNEIHRSHAHCLPIFCSFKNSARLRVLFFKVFHRWMTTYCL